MLSLLALALSTLSVAARPGQIHGHTVQNIHTDAEIVQDPSTVATFAFFSESETCESTPAYLRAQNFTCYGPIAKKASFQLVSINENCTGRIPQVSI